MQAIWFLSGQKRSGHPIKDARIGFAGAPYRMKLGTIGRKLLTYRNSMSKSRHGFPGMSLLPLSFPSTLFSPQKHDRHLLLRENSGNSTASNSQGQLDLS